MYVTLFVINCKTGEVIIRHNILLKEYVSGNIQYYFSLSDIPYIFQWDCTLDIKYKVMLNYNQFKYCDNLMFYLDEVEESVIEYDYQYSKDLYDLMIYKFNLDINENNDEHVKENDILNLQIKQENGREDSIRNQRIINNRLLINNNNNLRDIINRANKFSIII